MSSYNELMERLKELSDDVEEYMKNHPEEDVVFYGAIAKLQPVENPETGEPVRHVLGGAMLTGDAESIGAFFANETHFHTIEKIIAVMHGLEQLDDMGI